MKITKRQLTRLIRETREESFSPMKSRAHRDIRNAVERQRHGHIHEMWGGSVETGSDLIDFAKAYAGLGNAVQQQVEALSNAWLLQGAHEPDWSEAVYEQNPNAIEMAGEKLMPILKILAREGWEEASDLLNMFEDAQEVYRKGDAEVEADAAAAGDR